MSKRDDRMKLVKEHFQRENAHDLDGIGATFGEKPGFFLNGLTLEGSSAIRGLYGAVFEGFPNMRFDLEKMYEADDAVIGEGVLVGNQRGPWQGIPPTGRAVQIPFCGIFTFDAKERIASERVYFDGALLLSQLGVLPKT